MVMFSDSGLDYDLSMAGWIYLIAISAIFILLVKMVEDFIKARRQDH